MGKFAIIRPEYSATTSASTALDRRNAEIITFPARVPVADSGTLHVSGASRSAWRKAWVTMAVHADAFRINSTGYLTALAWRLRGLRVRSRIRLSLLASQSPRVYDLWIARDEPRALAAAKVAVAADVAKMILPVVDCRAGVAGLAQTLDSLKCAAASAPAILIGGPKIPGTITIMEPSELADLIGADEVWLCVLRAGDRLAAGAFTIYAGAAQLAGDAGLIYSDDDLLSPNGKRCTPHFKPSWNPDLFEHHDFLTGACIVRAARNDLARLPSENWEQAVISSAATRATAPLHMPLVLHHRVDRPDPIVPDVPAMLLSDAAPTVTAIIPTRNQVELLRACIDGLGRTAYPGLDILVVDNGSDEPQAVAYLEWLKSEGVTVLHIPGPFNFSALNNAAVEQARGELICFLNNDVEMVDPDWLALLVRQAMRQDIGAVGARLLYPDGTIQHAGVFVGIGGAAGHGHRLQSSEESGYFERARLPQRVSAVTAACLVVAREKFRAVGGFDEQDFRVAFNDVDLCMKLNDRGWASFYEPRATLIHHESKSRGNDRAEHNRDRFAVELGALKRKWQTDKRRDPYHHPHLSGLSEQFLIEI